MAFAAVGLVVLLAGVAFLRDFRTWPSRYTDWLGPFFRGTMTPAAFRRAQGWCYAVLGFACVIVGAVFLLSNAERGHAVAAEDGLLTVAGLPVRLCAGSGGTDP